jgi:hypothetical protein
MSKQGLPGCIFCGEKPLTVEHVFKSAWKNKLALPEGKREFYQVKAEGAERIANDSLFGLTTKSVCANCNNGWMNDLDLCVENWVMDPDGLDPGCTPRDLRRWAMKIAILRSRWDQPDTLSRERLIIPPDDMARLYDGEDLDDWHIFIGRAQRPEHRHNFCSLVGGHIDEGYMAWGVLQMSWSLGTALVTALRIAEEPGRQFLKSFKGYNREQGTPFAEVLSGTATLPALADRPAIPNWLILRFFWFFAPNDASPIAQQLRSLHSAVNDSLQAQGLPPIF